MNLPGRSYIPHLGQLMREAGAPQVSAKALCELRSAANRAYPGDGTLRKFVYERSLIQRKMALGVLEVLNFHLHQRGLRTINDDAIAEFEAYIEGYGPFLNFMESVPHVNKDPISEIASISNYTTDVVVSLKKKRLVPAKVATDVLNATNMVFSAYPAPPSITGRLKVTIAPVNKHTLQPIAGKGRGDVISALANVKI